MIKFYASLSLIFNNPLAVFFVEEMTMTLVNSAEPELNETQGYAISRYKLFTILLVTPAPFHCMSSSVTDKSHVHTRIEQSVVFKIIFQDLIR